MRKRTLSFLVLILALLPVFVYADANSIIDGDGIIMGNAHIFNVDPSDPSLAYLGQLFGTVGGVLHGTSGQLLGQIFQIFNIGMLIISAIFFIFTIISTVTHTAYEGKFMGPKQSKPAFAILRTVFGFGLLVPLPSGYSMIQAMTMWIVIQGIGFANTAWNSALDYFNQGGVALVKPSISVADNVNLAGTVLTAQVCMLHQQKQSQDEMNHNTAGTSGFVSPFTPTFVGNSVRFPALPGNSPKDAGCGEFSWDTGTPEKNGTLKVAMKQMINDTFYAARHIVDPKELPVKMVREAARDAVQNAAADWINLTIPVRAKTDQKISEFLDKAKAQGWLFAGQYYWDLTSLQSELDDDTKWQFKITQPIRHITTAVSGSVSVISFPEDPAEFRRMISQAANEDGKPSLASDYMKVADFVSGAARFAKEYDQKAEGAPKGVTLPNGGDTPLASLMGPLYENVNAAEAALMGNSATNTDPMLILQIAGNHLMSVMTAVLIIGSIAVFGISAGFSIFSSVNSLGYAFRDMLNMLLPVMMGLCTVLFVQGMVLALYIPLVPFIIYLFSALGWFVTVIESMAAAPLVALGLTHNEGHDVWGRSEEAMWLLLNVFLRPILMILGLLAGMILSRISLKILMIGFHHLTAVMHPVNAGNDAFYVVARLLIFISLVTVVVNSSYSLIYKIPDKVMRWLRAGGDQVSEYIQQAERGAQDMTNQTGQAQARMGQDVASNLGWRVTQSMERYGQELAKRDETKPTGMGEDGRAPTDTPNSSDVPGGGDMVNRGYGEAALASKYAQRNTSNQPNDT